MKFIAFFALFCASIVLAQAPAKTPVHFDCSCDDNIGARYATAVRDLIAVSPRYQSTGAFKEGSGADTKWNYGIRVTSINPFNDEGNSSTALAVVFTYGELYLDSYIQVCGVAKIQSCAATTIAMLDKRVSN